MSRRARVLTSLFLWSAGDVLLLHRIGSRAVSDSWVGIGGHVEGAEIDDPEGSLLREVQEEVGLHASDLVDLTLRCVSTRDSGHEVRTTYYFTADLRSGIPRPTACDEGELRWFGADDLAGLPMPPTTAAALRHCLHRSSMDDRIFAVVAASEGCRVVALDQDGASPVRYAPGG